MKKLLFITGLLFVFLTNAQTTATVVSNSFSGTPVKDISENNFYYQNFNQTSKIYTLNKVDNANTTSTVLTKFVEAFGISSVFEKIVTYNDNKSIIPFAKTNASPSAFEILLVNGSNADVFSITTPQTIFNTNFIKKPNAGYFTDQTSIYKTTNYTAATTTNIFTFPGSSVSNSEFIQSLHENNDILYYQYVNNDPNVGTPRYLCKFQNGVNTIVESSVFGYFMFQNKLNGEVFAQRQLGNVTRFDVNGNTSTITCPFGRTLLTIVANKLIYLELDSSLIAQDPNTLAITVLTTGANSFNESSDVAGSANNGSVCYFYKGTNLWFTDGTTANQVAGTFPTDGSVPFKGDFCGNNFLSKGSVLGTLFGSPAYVDKLFKLTPTTFSEFYPDGNTSYIGATIPMTTNYGIFTNTTIFSPFTNQLYKIACNTTLGTVENNLSNSEIKIYPNPTSGNFNIAIDENLVGAKVSVFNVLGQKVKNFLLNNITTNQNLEAGIYILEIEKEGNKTSKKLIVN